MSEGKSVDSGGVRYRQQYIKCGKPDCPCRTDTAKRHGPYWYAFRSWQDDQYRWRRHSTYIGRTLPEGVHVD